MSATVTNLLERRTRRGAPALTFDTDHEALLFAASCIDDLRETAPDERNPARLALKLDQAAAVIEACIRLHRREDRHTTGDQP